jgi:tRNA threonylcarbamoyladenosine biosynthesis protein TsaE
MPIRLTSPVPEASPLVAKKLLMIFKDKKMFAFSGKMGAGKTTFIKHLCKQLGAGDIAVSPSFSIVNEYTTKDGNTLYHFDFYRIKDIKEVFDIGYEEYFYSGNYCFIEWPEKIKELLPDNCVYIRIEDPVDDQSRTLVFDTDDDKR